MSFFDPKVLAEYHQKFDTALALTLNRNEFAMCRVAWLDQELAAISSTDYSPTWYSYCRLARIRFDGHWIDAGCLEPA